MNYLRIRSAFAAASLAAIFFITTGFQAKAQEPEAKAEAEAPLVESLKDLKELDREIVGMANASSEATVALIAKRGGGSGSGVVVSGDGIILTAAHVVEAVGDEVIVVFPDGTQRDAETLGADFDRDAGMVRITEKGTYPSVELGSSEDLLRNDWCIATGHPGGFDPARTPPLRLGRILWSERFIVTDCAIVGGDSGGPLFDRNGEVIGIHSNIGSSLMENRHVPVSVYIDQWDKLKSGERFGRRFTMRGPPLDPERPVLGLQLGPPAKGGGVTVMGIMPNSPAGRKGIQRGDVITAINENAVASPEELIEIVGEYDPGDAVNVSFLRGEREQGIKVELARLGDLLPGRRGAPRDREKEEGETEDEDEDADESDKRPASEKTDKKPEPGNEKNAEKSAEGGKSADKKRSDAREKRKNKKGNNEPPKETKKDETKEKAGPGERKSGDGAKPSGDKSADAKRGDALFEELVRQAIEKGRFELTPEQLKRIGGVEGLRERFEEKMKSLGMGEFGELAERRALQQLGPDRFFESSMKALAPVMRKVSGATVTVQADGKPVALGTVVTDDGAILTMNSETLEGAVTMKSGDEVVALELIKRFPKRDLALFRAESDSLKPITWAGAGRTAPVGSLLTASGPDGRPLGIGLVSVQTRALAEIGFLGIEMGETDAGIRVVRVLKDGPAEKAGLKSGDVITRLDGEEAGTPMEFAGSIRRRKTGQEVALEYLRGDENGKLQVVLGERESSGGSPRFDRMNQMSGPLSEIKTGFPRALQHDIPLEPSQCGGPLLDLDGRCIGINISRAGRVKTFAIPAADVQALLDETRPEIIAAAGKAEAEGGAEAETREHAKSAPASISRKERDEILETLGELRKSLQAVEKRVRELEVR